MGTIKTRLEQFKAMLDTAGAGYTERLIPYGVRITLSADHTANEGVSGLYSTFDFTREGAFLGAGVWETIEASA